MLLSMRSVASIGVSSFGSMPRGRVGEDGDCTNPATGADENIGKPTVPGPDIMTIGGDEQYGCCNEHSGGQQALELASDLRNDLLAVLAPAIVVAAVGLTKRLVQ